MPSTILIGEDEPFIVESLTFLLEGQGHKVVTAFDGEETLKVLRARRPDLLILDVMMKHYTGFDILNILRQDADLSATKVLMLTAKGQESDRQLAIELGANHYIAKPFSNKDVLAAVSNLLAEPTIKNTA